MSLDQKEPRECGTDRSIPAPICRSRLDSGWLDILTNSICLALPMVSLTAALVIYVLMNQVKSDVQGSALLMQNTTTPNDNAFYVDADSTMLVFLASWMSSVAPLLTGSAITLATYPIASQLLGDSDRAQNGPTPFEFSIMLKVIGGSTWGGLWALFLYIFGWKQHISRQSAALASLTIVMVVTMVLSILVLGADTWLHIATTTVSLTRIFPFATDQASYSFSLSPECTSTNNSLVALREAGVSCTLNGTNAETVFYDPSSTTATLNNQSTSIGVHQMPNSDLSYLSPVPGIIDTSYDFAATTYAVSTKCKSISEACNLANDGNITFDCNNGAFYAEGTEMSNQGLVTQVFKNFDLSDVEDINQYYGIHNPFYVTAATANAFPIGSPLRNDPEIVAPRYTVSAILLCNVTILDLEYASRGGHPYVIRAVPSNISVTNVFASGVSATPFGYDNMRAAMNMAALQATYAQDFADKFAVTLSATVLSAGAGSVRRVPVTLVQQRKQTLVARVPKPPFFFLTSINIGYIILAVVLAVLAARTSHEVRQVQYRLTTAGVVAGLLDREHSRNNAGTIQELYGEYHGSAKTLRVGVDRTSKGGFEFRAVPFRNEIDEVQNSACESDMGVHTTRRTVGALLRLSRTRRVPLQPLDEGTPHRVS